MEIARQPPRMGGSGGDFLLLLFCFLKSVPGTLFLAVVEVLLSLCLGDQDVRCNSSVFSGGIMETQQPLHNIRHGVSRYLPHAHRYWFPARLQEGEHSKPGAGSAAFSAPPQRGVSDKRASAPGLECSPFTMKATHRSRNWPGVCG